MRFNARYNAHDTHLESDNAICLAMTLLRKTELVTLLNCVVAVCVL